jgi:hypothetical protein
MIGNTLKAQRFWATHQNVLPIDPGLDAPARKVFGLPDRPEPSHALSVRKVDNRVCDRMIEAGFNRRSQFQ